MFGNKRAGILSKDNTGYSFTYDKDYLITGSPVSSSLPLQSKSYQSEYLFPFFQGLLPEGWYNDIVCRQLKIDTDDEFSILADSCTDCIGAVWLRKSL